jgi:hypothetical protein
MSDERLIPINLELRRKGITFIYMTKFFGSDALFVTIEAYNDTLVFSRYNSFNDFIKKSEAQLLSHSSSFSAEDIEWLQCYLITKYSAFEDAAKELRE